jgi:translation initiation factor 1
MSEMCSTCGLPEELCVCEDVSKTSSDVLVELEERKFNDVTIVKSIPSGIDKSDLASYLKSNLACGGTVNDNGNIELQGDHLGNVEELLEQEGYNLTVSA